MLVDGRVRARHCLFLCHTAETRYLVELRRVRRDTGFRRYDGRKKRYDDSLELGANKFPTGYERGFDFACIQFFE